MNPELILPSPTWRSTKESSASDNPSQNMTKEELEHRRLMQRVGRHQSIRDAYRRLTSSGVPCTPAAIRLVEQIAEESYRLGIETMADIVQPDFMRKDELIGLRPSNQNEK